MNKKVKIFAGVAAAITVLGVAGFTLAADDDQPLTGSVYDRATEAALEHVGEGSVIETEFGDGGAAYSVEVRRSDGSVVEVGLNKDFRIIGTEADDDTGGDNDD